MARTKQIETPEYMVWKAMKRRCYGVGHKSYPFYGGRGIRVCDEWCASFSAFLAYLGPRPSPKHTLDRINNDGNYEPGNVRWVTRLTQANNRRSVHQITHDGRTMSAAAWAREVGMGRAQILHRLKVFPPEKALDPSVSMPRAPYRRRASNWI